MSEGALMILGIHGPQLSVEEARRFRELQPAGYILFSRNMIDPQQTRQLTDDLRDLSEELPLIAIDEEGGRVSRIRGFAACAPSAQAMGAHADMGKIADAAEMTTDLLLLLGVNWNFAPVLDLDHFPNAANAMGGRCWSRNPQRVIDYVGQWNRWARKRGIVTCAKHFPAGGRAMVDPHHDLPSSSATLEELLREDVIPYTALMPELDAIMLAHVDFPAIDASRPASLSARIIRRFLRDQLGFDRQVLIPDDLDMAAIQKRFGRGEDARLAIEAGNDLALICHQTEGIEAVAKSIEELPCTILEEAHQRVHRLRRKLKTPVPWTDAAWQGACSRMAALGDVIKEPQAIVEASPVQDY
ncbi:MAG: beta-N-acetylhexosaminidase [Verrucomicrobia bacterium]|nr:MAG: beta-N-acetylhexosaminidase [Verrucomicrobiota bacterium]